MINQELEDPEVWSDPKRVEVLGRERSQLAKVVSTLENTGRAVEDSLELLAPSPWRGLQQTFPNLWQPVKWE